MVRILILGGTGEAATLAAKLATLPSLEVVSSLAGRTHQPSALVGAVRSGGFGGSEGLATYLKTEHVDVLVDATHPFAAQISWNAVAAAAETGVAYLRLERPAWVREPGDRWIEVESVTTAVSAIPSAAKRIFLTIGRQQLAAFSRRDDLWFLMRMIDPPEVCQPLPRGELLLSRGPFSLAQERQLLQAYQINVMVSKNSGGDATYAKVVAARELGLPVVMVQRPTMPLGETVADTEEAINWLQRFLMIG